MSVYQEIIKFQPPGTAHWGTNRSNWKQGYLYVHGEDEIPMESIVESAVVDPSTVEFLTNEEGLERESATAPTLVEDPD